MNVWPVISEGKASPRDEVVYNIGPFFAAVRQGDWKLVWKATLPSKVELFNLAQDPSESMNLADKTPQKVAELQRRIELMAKEGVEPLFLVDALGAAQHVLFGSVSTPEEEKDLESQP